MGQKMKSSSPRRELQALLEAIKSSEVVETRVQLLNELEELDIDEKSAVDALAESLTIYWEDFTCLDISQCTLNKTVLHVAAKYLETDISSCLVQFLVLGTKANVWCRKHLQMTLMSMEDSPEEEHSSFFYQLVLDLLSYSASSYSALARYHVSIDKDLVVNLASFISEEFTLMKDLVSELKNLHFRMIYQVPLLLKNLYGNSLSVNSSRIDLLTELMRIPLLGPELLKAAQMTVDAVTRLCKVYCNGVNWDMYHAKTEDGSAKDCKETENGDHVIHITNCTISKLCELGTTAANDGGSLVSLLNLSWKGVVSLLQLGKGCLATKVNITAVIMNLITLSHESLRYAAETWSSSMNEKVSVAEAKRIFLPIKFFLINAVRIISQYQTQAFLVYKEISTLVVMILTFRISLSMIEHLKSASDVLAEVLEPTSLHLLNSLFNSAQVKQEDKFQILDCLFGNRNDMSSEAESSYNRNDPLDFIFSVNPDAVDKEKALDQGRVALFISLLTCATDLEDNIILGIARKLGWLLDILVEEDIYCSILVFQTPKVDSSTQTHELTYQPLFSAVLHALKTFMIVASSSPSWNEVESFLIENLFHPHFLCWEIVTELWCFILRHAEANMVNNIVDKLCMLLMSTSGESVLFPNSALRKIARLICILVTYGPEFMIDQVYSTIFDDSRSQCALNVHVALLIEGFPLNLLSEKKRSIAKQRIITQYYDFVEGFEDFSTGESGIYGAPVFALCAALQSLQVSLTDTDMKTLKFLVAIIHKYKTTSDVTTKDDYQRLVGELLGIISSIKHLYSFDEMEEVILELQNLFISKPAQSDTQLFLCKPNLAHFMAGLGHVELSDSDNSAKTSAAWELYHMLLKERHWAFIHLALTAFGYFAAHTSCNHLWRFVPHDAALSFDLDSGSEAEEERFMSELKAVLEKEIRDSPDRVAVVVKDGRALREVVRGNVGCDREGVVCDVMDVDNEKQPNKKRKFPDGICRGVEVLQSGLKIVVDGLSEWQMNQRESGEVCDRFLAHFSRLEDEIAHLATLAKG